MTIGELKNKIEHLPDEMEVCYNDPNFNGKYWVSLEPYNIDMKKENDTFYLGIDFPFETAVE